MDVASGAVAAEAITYIYVHWDGLAVSFLLQLGLLIVNLGITSAVVPPLSLLIFALICNFLQCHLCLCLRYVFLFCSPLQILVLNLMKAQRILVAWGWLIVYHVKANTAAKPPALLF